MLNNALQSANPPSQLPHNRLFDFFSPSRKVGDEVRIDDQSHELLTDKIPQITQNQIMGPEVIYEDDTHQNDEIIETLSDLPEMFISYRDPENNGNEEVSQQINQGEDRDEGVFTIEDENDNRT